MTTIGTIPSATLMGVEGAPVWVEVHVSNGLPGFTIVGLPDAACRESRDRVRAALLSSDLTWPLRRVTVNLAPSGVRKGGAGLDLPIAIGLLVACGALGEHLVDGHAFIGELGLDGSLRAVAGIVPMVDAIEAGTVVVPTACANEAELVEDRTVRSAPTLRAAMDALAGRAPWPRPPASTERWRGCASARSNGRAQDRDPAQASRGTAVAGWEMPEVPDMADVHGQPLGRRAVEVAAAGGHHLLLLGPPGSGKTMLARRLLGLLPPLNAGEALEVSKVHSAAGLPIGQFSSHAAPPFRAPHHGASPVSLIGGGTAWMRPGEISLASGGVLFLDELGEFPRIALEALRQPIEEGVVNVCRARGSHVFPARVLLVAAMNPCPCGFGGLPGRCRCSPAARSRYAQRLSAPLLDRFDLAVRLDRTDPDELVEGDPAEPSAAIAARVSTVRLRCRERGVRTNAEIPPNRLDDLAPLTPEARRYLTRKLREGGLSARGLARVRRTARTIADLEGGDERVAIDHVAEALALRAARDALVSEADRP